ncbi:MAG: PPC domain-containing DNA-binding protein [Saprospiraceae bacterium]
MNPSSSEHNLVFILRLGPDKDLKKEIIAFAKAHHIRAGYIITCVGSLKKASLRLADLSIATTWTQKFEIVSLVGTLAEDGSAHLHLSISDSTGNTLGGHLLDDNLIYTTAEIVIGEAMDLKFTREEDSLTTFKELVVEKRD